MTSPSAGVAGVLACLRRMAGQALAFRESHGRSESARGVQADNDNHAILTAEAWADALAEIAREQSDTDATAAAYRFQRIALAALGGAAPAKEGDDGVDLCEVAKELERVHAAHIIAEVAAIAGDRTDAYWSGHSLACEEIAHRLGLQLPSTPAAPKGGANSDGTCNCTDGRCGTGPATPAGGGGELERLRSHLREADDRGQMLDDLCTANARWLFRTMNPGESDDHIEYEDSHDVTAEAVARLASTGSAPAPSGRDPTKLCPYRNRCICLGECKHGFAREAAPTQEPPADREPQGGNG